MRQVVWTTTAKADLSTIVAYIAADSPRAAQRVSERIGDTAGRLVHFATGRHIPSLESYQQFVPRLPNVILYRLRRAGGVEVVEIIRVIHSSRDWLR